MLVQRLEFIGSVAKFLQWVILINYFGPLKQIK